MARDLLGFVAALVIATITTPVGVSGAVFLLPVQLSLLGVPSPQITPTNLLFNLFAAPGALLRYRRSAVVDGRLVAQISVGSVPGILVGAALRVHIVPDLHAFRLIAAGVLLPMGVLVLRRRPLRMSPLSSPALAGLAFVVGTIGGLYGIGGGSLLAPLLVGTGMSVTRVAPAALMSTFLTSAVGVVAYAVLAKGASGHVEPNWALGIACGLGGLLGGSLGARLQAHVPERRLRDGLGLLAIALSLAYAAEGLL
jgi:hypothetical protein